MTALRCDRCRRVVGASETVTRVNAARVWLDDDRAERSGEYETIRVEVCSHCARDVETEIQSR